MALVVFLGWAGWSAGLSLISPGNTGNVARLAEWARDHNLGPVITLGEWLTYQAAKTGGKPSFSLAAPSARASSPLPSRRPSGPRSQPTFLPP